MSKSNFSPIHLESKNINNNNSFNQKSVHHDQPNNLKMFVKSGFTALQDGAHTKAETGHKPFFPAKDYMHSQSHI